MKKTLIVAAVFAAAILGMTSCSKDTKKCWKTTESYTNGASVSVTAYVWATENEMEASKKQVESVSGVKYTYTAESSAKTESDCTNKNAGLISDLLD